MALSTWPTRCLGLWFVQLTHDKVELAHDKAVGRKQERNKGHEHQKFCQGPAQHNCPSVSVIAKPRTGPDKVELFQHQPSLTNQSVCCLIRWAKNYLWPSGRNPSQRRRTVATTGAAVNSQSRYHCEGLEQTLDKVIDQMALKGIFVLTKNSSCINAAAARNHGEDQTSIYETHLEIIALFFKAIAKDTLQSSGIWSCTSH